MHSTGCYLLILPVDSFVRVNSEELNIPLHPVESKTLYEHWYWLYIFRNVGPESQPCGQVSFIRRILTPSKALIGLLKMQTSIGGPKPVRCCDITSVRLSPITSTLDANFHESCLD